MADGGKTFAEKRLTITREAELLQSFVRVTVNEDLQEEETFAQVIERQKAEREKLKGEKATAAAERRPKARAEKLKQEKPKVEKEEPRKMSLDEEGRLKQAPLSPETTRKLSKQLQKTEVKKRGRRRKKRNGIRSEELYCDKDRAAAVNLGSKDIKQSLKLKRKQDRSKALNVPEEAEPGTFLALGNYGMCRGDLHIACDFISKALELNPTEKNALVARSKCYILLGQPENALRDAETSLQIDKNFIKAIYQKAEALYYLGDFEHSLVYYHRGLHLRPDHEGFKLGVQKAQKAIENALGVSFPGLAKPPPPAPVSKESSTRQTPTTATKTSQRTTPMGAGRARTARPSRLLRELGADKDYLDNLMNNPDIKCKYKEEDNTIERTIQETVDYLNARQEFWRQQLPAGLK